MSKTLTATTQTDDPAQYEAMVEQYLADIDRLREQMSRDQAEIDGSRARTQAMLDELAVMVKPALQKAA